MKTNRPAAGIARLRHSFFSFEGTPGVNGMGVFSACSERLPIYK